MIHLWRRRILAAVLSLMILGLPVVAHADGKPIGLYLDGHQVVTDVPPAIVDGRTLVPVRSIVEALGGTVQWDPTTRTVTIQRRGHQISLQLDSQQAIVDDKPVTLDVPAQIMDGRTVVPVRFIVEAFGGEVDWDASQGAVVLAIDNEALKEKLRVDKKNRTLPSDPLHYSRRATEAGLTLSEPSRETFATDGAVKISGQVGKTFANASLLVKVTHNYERDTSLQAHDGTFSGTIYLAEGAGRYDISIWIPESPGSSWYYEATTLQVENVNPLPQFGPYYRPNFFRTGLQFDLPTNGQIAVDTYLPLEGNAPASLEGRFLWVQAEKGGTKWDTYVPIRDGKFSGPVYLGGGPGIYWATVLLQNDKGSDYYTEIANIPVVNTSPTTVARPVALEPAGFRAGLTVDPFAPQTETGGLQVSGTIDPKFNGRMVWFVAKNGDRKDDQLYLPVNNGRFQGSLPLTLGPGDYEVTIRVPVSADWYLDAATLHVRNEATQVFQGFHYYVAGIRQGLHIDQPASEQSTAKTRFTLAGTIEHYDTSQPYLIAETRLGDLRANYRLPITNGRFQGDVWLRFGQGQYEVTLWYPQTNTQLVGLVRLQVTNTETSDLRDLAPSMGIETEDPGIIALAQKLTDGKNPRDAAHAVFEWVARNVTYDYGKAAFSRVDPDEGAVRTLRTRTGVCRDYAALTVALLRAAKMPAHEVVGDALAGFTWQSHAWVEVLIDGKWVQMDPTFASGVIDGTTFVPRYDPRYFDPPADWFHQDHHQSGIRY